MYVTWSIYLTQYFILFQHTEKKKDPTYATGSKRGVYDESLDRKIREAVIDDLLSLVHNYDHCAFVFMRYFGVRGGSEGTTLVWDQVQFKTYLDGPFKGRNYVELKIDEDKGMYI